MVPSLVDGAKVSLSDDTGNTIPLMEDSIGRYLTPKTFAGQIGTKYKLNIELQEGKQYESEYVELLDVPDIAELNAEYLTRPASVTTYSDEGYQFYINTEPGNNEQKYFKWEITDDSEYHLKTIFYYYWDGNSLSDVNISNICYFQSHLREISVGTSNNSQTNSLTNYPFCFSPKSWKFKFGYGIKVKQYSLSQFSYNFWKGALENNFRILINSKQPYQLTGNLKCISNPGEPVFGIFEASAVKEKGIQVEKIHYPDELPMDRTYSYPKIISCSSIYLPNVDLETIRGWYAGYIGVPADPPPGWSGFLLVRDNRCVFCELTEGTSIRPDYWGKIK